MSQSPTKAEAPSDALLAYRQGWSALNELIGEGRSFSGKERNRAFLNLGAGRFANVSAASGLDRIDDARALAVTDWDFDGRLDFWLSNRTAPRVCFLRNHSGQDTKVNFLAVRLHGTKGNRDAIGARVELQLAGQSTPRIKTLHAGEGFLGQSTKWLHFGLGESAKIDRLTVHWPKPGGSEIFRGLTPGGHFTITEGLGKPETWTPPAMTLPKAEDILEPSSDQGIRTWLMGRVPLPAATWRSWEGKGTASKFNGPLLLNLWSATCAPCLAELTEWTSSAAPLKSAGLRIVALGVDQLGDPNAVATSRKTFDKLKFPFESGLATEDLVNGMESVHRTFLELQKPLPVPTSFLLDKQGRVAAIYKGRVSVATLLEDLQLLDAPLEDQRAKAVPYPGRWSSTPFSPNPARVAGTLLKAGQRDRAVAYLTDFLANASRYLDGLGLSDAQSGAVLAACQETLGDLHLQQGDLAKAVAAYQSLLSFAPGRFALHRRIGEALLSREQAQPALLHLKAALPGALEDSALLFNIGLAELGLNQVNEAIGHLEAATRGAPSDLANRFHLGNAYRAANRPHEAAKQYREALRIQPNWPYAAQALAWLIANSSDPKVGDPKEAVALAEALCQSTQRRDVGSLHTLAVAYASAGHFQEAIGVIDEALKLIDPKSPRYAQLEEIRASFLKMKKPF